MRMEIDGLGRFSRHAFCTVHMDADKRLFLSAREPYRYAELGDTIKHVVHEGHTLFNLAGFYYSRVERAAGLWWIIADFQPVPLLDPTVQLQPGQLLYVPSMRTVITEIFSELRSSDTFIP